MTFLNKRAIILDTRVFDKLKVDAKKNKYMLQILVFTAITLPLIHFGFLNVILEKLTDKSPYC